METCLQLDPANPLLVNERGTFSHSFMGYLMASTLRTGDRDGIRE